MIEEQEAHKTISLTGMFKSWFLDYASYVILERAVPDILDGLKPVQRRILHSMYELDDGRYNKVANVVGNTMKYHPHGDASIGDALVQLGQKNLLIDCQGNWGNVPTGDSAAAPRYIEARLSAFANQVVFNPKTTNWKPSYDGRNQEPIALPIKFPLLLVQGVEGIAVGLASKVLPHNFNELIDASIRILKGQDFELYPDFLTGGYLDVSNYNDGLRGGRIRIRAKIAQLDKKTLIIQEIPFGTTTGSLIESILKANEKGKIKVRKVEDNTAQDVEILVHLQAGVSPDTSIDALYAFTDCEISVSPNACVIVEKQPKFIGVREILEVSTYSTMNLLKKELEISLEELELDWHYTSLEKIFFEQRIYRELEKDVAQWDDLLEAIELAFVPYIRYLKREITRDDILKLTDKPVRKISKFDVKKADEHLLDLEAKMEEVKSNLANLVDYTIHYFETVKKKFGKNRGRKTEIRSFETIQAQAVAANNAKLYVNREEGFFGSNLKKDEFVCDCSDLDDIISFKEDGSFIVTKLSDKVFVGKNIIHIGVFRKNDERCIYNMIYQNGKLGFVYAKRFSIGGITRDKEYDLTQGEPQSKILYLSANPNGEAEKLKVIFKNKPGIPKLQIAFDFKVLSVKSRSVRGSLLSKNAIQRISLEDQGVSTLGARKIWFDSSVQRLNIDERGILLGEFKGEDKILCIHKSGYFRLMNFDLSTHFDLDLEYIAKYSPETIITAVYQLKKTKLWYIKRFQIEPNEKKQFFIEEGLAGLSQFSVDKHAMLALKFNTVLNKKEVADLNMEVEKFVGIKSYKAKAKQISPYAISKLSFLKPKPEEIEAQQNESGKKDSEDDKDSTHKQASLFE